MQETPGVVPLSPPTLERSQVARLSDRGAVPRNVPVDLTGVRVTDLVRLYFDRVDTGSNAVVCPEVISDTRLVSLRAAGADVPEAVVGVLASVGYAITKRSGVVYVCPVEESRARRFDGYSASAGVVVPSQSAAADEPSSPREIPLLDETESRVDRLFAADAQLVGCSRSRMSFRVPGYGVVYATRAEVKKSKAGAIWRCLDDA